MSVTCRLAAASPGPAGLVSRSRRPDSRPATRAPVSWTVPAGAAPVPDRVVEEQVAAERDPVGDQRGPCPAGQHSAGQVELPVDPGADEAHQPLAGEPAPEQHRAVDRGVVGEQAADRAAAEVEQRQRRPAQHQAAELAAPQPDPHPGPQPVQVERAGQRRAAQLEPARVDRAVHPEQHVPHDRRPDRRVRRRPEVQLLAGGGRFHQPALGPRERRHGAEG
jgi:hypothetical protein